MKLKTLIGLAVAGAFALPMAAQASADGDRMILVADGPSGASSTGTGMTGGTPSAQSSGEPRAPTQGAPSSSSASTGATGASAGATGGAAADFASLDSNGDGQITRAEWDAHYRSGSAGASSSGGATSGAPSGPGTKSQAGSGSDTATTPGTSGKGKAQ